MRARSIVVALAAGLALMAISAEAQAQYLQPGMRTMIQQGGVEGTILGPVRPLFYYPYRPVYADPYDGYGPHPRAHHSRRWYRPRHAHRAYDRHRPFGHVR